MASEVIEALNNAYTPVLTLFEQAHRQEHVFEVRYRYTKLQERFDKIVHDARSWRRALLNRIVRLEGEVTATMSELSVSDDVKGAYDATLRLLDLIHSQIGQAVAVAQSANDHPTVKMLYCLQADVDHKRAKVEAWLRQVKDLRETYLVTVV
jgi:bacterioferritin (cytochrome b1)